MPDPTEISAPLATPNVLPKATAGVTYICVATIPGQTESQKNPVCVVCHYNDGNLERHTEEGTKDTFDYHGYVYNPSDSLPDYSKPAVVLGEHPTTTIEGKFCEALLRPDHIQNNLNPYAMFIRFMINPEAATLDYLKKDGSGSREGHGFPVGWAVRGYLPEELARRNHEWQKNYPNDELKNAMNMLPVFRADFKDLIAKCPKDWGDRQGEQNLRRAYYITNQPQYQLLKPKSLHLQIREADPDLSPSNDDPSDIAKAHQDVQVRET